MFGNTLKVTLLAITACWSINAAATDVILQEQTVKGDANGPQLTFIADESNPGKVVIAFKADGEAAVDTRSFRIRYGMLGIDVTDEFLEHGELNAEQVTVSRSLLEPGKYRLTVEIGDDRERRTVMKMRLLVKGSNS